MGRKRSVVDRSEWNFVLRISGSLRQRLQRILFAADDRAVAFNPSRGVHRIPESHQKRGLGSAVGFSLLRLETVARSVFWRAPRQTGARRTSACQRLLIFAAVDQFPPLQSDLYPRFIHTPIIRHAF